MRSTSRRMTTLAGSLVAALCIVGCGTMGTISTVTDAAAMAGQTTFANDCANCHTASSLKSASGKITNNLGSLSSAMNGITLTDTEVSNLMAYLATQ